VIFTTNAAQKLEAWLREECSATARTQALLDQGLESLRKEGSQGVRALAAELESHAARSHERSAQRELLVRALASRWGVAPGTLTLSSIAARLGAEGAPMRALREELRAALARLARSARKLHALARYQHQLFNDLLEAVLREHTGAMASTTGALLDAEG
jgi:hypothetical protein